MTDEALLKTKSTLDNRDFNKGVQQMKKEMRDLDKVSSDAFAAIGSAIGIDTRQIQQFSSALAGLGNKLAQTGKEGSSAFSSIAKSITPVAAGIAGLGLAAAIAAFKQLNAEADAFENTIQGGLIKAQTDAYLSTYRQALRDQSGVGEGVAGFRQTVRYAWNEIAGFFQSGMNFDRMKEANQLAGRAKEIAGEIYNIDLQRKENAVRISELDAQIARAREDMIDPSKSTAEHAAALANAQQLIKEKLDLQLPLEERRRDLIIEMNGLVSDTMQDFEAEISAKISVNNLIQQEAAEQSKLLQQQKQINAALQEEKSIREHWAAAHANAIGLVESGPVLDNQVQVPVTFIIPQEAKTQLENDIIDITTQCEELVVSLSSAFGELFADLASGEDAWGNFSNAALSAFGDMAIAVGKIAIETGMASEGIKAALELSEGGAYVAIAAGIALVALGSAVKAGLSNIANGNYSASANVASSGSYSAGNSYETRDLNIHISGNLRADGDQLVAVINNTTNRNGYTT